MGSGEAKKFRAQFGSAGRHGDSFWKEEQDNIGMKLLKGMGWDAGQGLGKNGQGMATAVKQIRKQDNRGIGATAATRDEAFKASQDLFNGVLARLNGKGDDASAAGGLGGSETTIKGSIAKRQLAGRFRRAKDTSMASASDLAAIFGRAPSKEGGAAAGDVSSAAPGAVEAPSEQKTSSLSLQEYFAQKRRELGLAPAAGGGGGGGGGGAGFSLDDQAMFAEQQAAAAYSGRVGLGGGGYRSAGGGGGGSWVPEKRYTDASWTDPKAAMPTPAALAARAGGSGGGGGGVPSGGGVEREGKEARKAKRKEEKRLERKAAKKAAKKAAAGEAAPTAKPGDADAAEKRSKKKREGEAATDADEAARAAKKSKRERAGGPQSSARTPQRPAAMDAAPHGPYGRRADARPASVGRLSW